MTADSIPLIADVVDLDAWPYVVPKSWIVETFLGPCALPLGFLSDGASGLGIWDLDPESFMVHDRLYVSPMLGTRRINKLQADLIYAHLLLKRRHIFSGVVRPVALCVVGWKAWRGHRKQERRDPGWWLTQRFVPHATAWTFPNWRTENAVYIGPPVQLPA
jgi:hypothetical protein